MNERQRRALTKVLNSVSSWSGARFDQHLRYEVGDKDADEILGWLDREARVEFDRTALVLRTREETDRTRKKST